MKHKKQLALVANIIIFITEIIATTMSFKANQWASFQFYTIDANILALIASATYLYCRLRKRQPGSVCGWLKYTATINLSLTFLIVVTVLGPTMGYSNMLLNGPMPFHHVIDPILCLISYLCWETDVPSVSLISGMIVTGIYAITLIILNITQTVVGPYPFLRVLSQPIYMSVLWLVLIGGGTVLIGWLIKKFRHQ